MVRRIHDLSTLYHEVKIFVMSKTIEAKISLDHSDTMVMALNATPEMRDTIKFLGGIGTVDALNSNYKGTDETWLIVKWSDGTQESYRYLFKE